jgi:hypothetical protein
MSFEPVDLAGTVLYQGEITILQPQAEVRSVSHELLDRSGVIPRLAQRSDKAVEKRRCWRGSHLR